MYMQFIEFKGALCLYCLHDKALQVHDVRKQNTQSNLRGECDQTSDDGFLHDDSHAKNWSMECTVRSTEDKDTTEVQLLQNYDTSCTSLKLLKPFSLLYSTAGKTSQGIQRSLYALISMLQKHVFSHFQPNAQRMRKHAQFNRMFNYVLHCLTS